ncbi:MAG: DeoR/GlpR family DNA-binding transcription regulator [Rhodoferax sp.]|nr:DeoR/GlpR family DNA-binding transcription regulator [Rhodoferax sp.]
MILSKRKAGRVNLIEKHLAQKGVLRLRDAVSLLGVSEMTVRRTLAESGERFSYYGGYILAAGSASSADAYDQQQETGSNAAAKALACEHALGLVKEEDTIFIDCGTTLDNLARLIPQDLSITVICYSLNVANWLARKPKVQTILLGGQFHPESATFSSMDGVFGGSSDDLSRFGIHKAFISAGGVDVARGVTCSYMYEAAMKRRAMEVAKKNYLVIDESKFNRLRPALFAKVDAFAAIISETGIR